VSYKAEQQGVLLYSSFIIHRSSFHPAKEQAEQDFGGGILRFLLRDNMQVYIEVSHDEIIVRHIV